mmetsp:Transcript_117495/g.318958  ORF Transcript_117495/g.318958 Transcript_117495/m.318958 type:complete len:201 (+) Transcript_117495:1219-1821(+)
MLPAQSAVSRFTSSSTCSWSSSAWSSCLKNTSLLRAWSLLRRTLLLERSSCVLASIDCCRLVILAPAWVALPPTTVGLHAVDLAVDLVLRPAEVALVARPFARKAASLLAGAKASGLFSSWRSAIICSWAPPSSPRSVLRASTRDFCAFIRRFFTKTDMFLPRVVTRMPPKPVFPSSPIWMIDSRLGATKMPSVEPHPES